MKRILALVLALCLGLCGCSIPGGSEGDTAGSAALTAPAVPRQTLAVYYAAENPAAQKAVELYAAACDVELTRAETAEAAGLAVLGAAPAAGEYRELSGDALLAAAGARAGLSGSFCALPLGKTLYAYWAQRDVLAALLGEQFSLADLQCATWEEWSGFITALGGWLEEPQAETVSLNGKTYTLPAEKTGAAAGLQTVFALPADAWGAAACSSALVAAADTRTAGALTGPLNGLAACYLLERQAGAAEGAAADAVLADAPAAVFYRGALSELTGSRDLAGCQGLVPVPQKINLEEADLTTDEYNVAGLLNNPVLAMAGWLAIPAAADEAAAQAGASFLLWLYTGTAGEDALTETLGLISPWRTADDTTALGALQVQLVSAGVIPAAALSTAEADALQAAWKTAQAAGADAADKKAYLAGALAALGAAE